MPPLKSQRTAERAGGGSDGGRVASSGRTLGDKREQYPAEETGREISRGLAVVRAELGRLQTLDAASLRQEWRRLRHAEPPRLSRDLLVRALAYRLQEVAFGGLPKFALHKLGDGVGATEAAASGTTLAAERVKPGARLVREWRGRVYSVLVREQGFDLEGKTFGSLTQIAREITGANWSGPRFFGLTDRKGANRAVPRLSETSLDADVADRTPSLIDHESKDDEATKLEIRSRPPLSPSEEAHDA